MKEINQNKDKYKRIKKMLSLDSNTYKISSIHTHTTPFMKSIFYFDNESPLEIFIYKPPCYSTSE